MVLIRTIIVSLMLVATVIGSTANAIEFSFHNPLVDAADAGQVNEVRALLKARHSVDGRGDFNTTALMRAAYRGHTEIVQMLINSGANLSISDRGGATALHVAARAGHEAVVSLLLKYGAAVDVKDNEGWTPLMRAVMAKQPKVAEVLVKEGAEILAENESGQTPIVQAATSGSLEVLSALMESPDFQRVTLAQKEAALDAARKRKHRNIETVFSALLHPPAPPSAAYAMPMPHHSAEVPYGQQFHESAPIGRAALPSVEGHAMAAAEQPIAQGQYEVAVPDNGFELLRDAMDDLPEAPTPVQTKIASSIDGQHMAHRKRSQVKQVQVPVPQRAVTQNQQAYAQQVPMPHARPASYGAHPPMGGYAAPAPRYLLQLGAFANEDQAFYVWSNLKHRHPDVLASLEPDVLKAYLAYDKTEVYRLRAGNFTARTQAEQKCKAMRERSIECFVIEQSAPASAMPPAMPQQQMVQQHMPNNTLAPSYAPQQAGQPTHMAQAPMNSAAGQQPEYPVFYEQSPQQPMAPAPYGQVRPPYAAAPYGGAPMQQGYGQPSMQQGGGPINPMQQAPLPAPSPAYAGGYGNQPAPMAAASNDEIREMARKQFYRSQGTQPPAQQQHGDFYRDIQQLEQQRQRYGNVSEAVRVNAARPSHTGRNHLQQPNHMSGVWVHVGDFPNEQYAQDYYQRMFKYDRSFGHLGMVSMKENLPLGGGVAVSMRLGPAGSEAEAYDICHIVEQGGLNCNVLSGNSTSGYQRFETAGLQAGQGITHDTLDPFWLTLGTFEQSGDAEYYWMFLLEDHFDVLGALKYDLEQRAQSRREPYHLKAGPFLVMQQANRVCDVLKYRNIACVVTH